MHARAGARPRPRGGGAAGGGRVHGGVYVAMAESMASMGTASGIDMSVEIAAGRFNTTEVTGAPAVGALHATARRVHREPGEWLWDVTVEDDAGTICAMARVGIAVRALPTSGAGGGAWLAARRS